jgi:drug/metabolite transporter (DMT)-like permease
MVKSILFAGIAAIGNALFVYGQRGSGQSGNPFLFICGAVSICTLLFLTASFICKSGSDISYIASNYGNILISGIGFFITFIGFYLLYSRFGASHYIVYAVMSIMTTSIGVGVICYKEPFNIYHVGAMLLAMLSICFYSYGQYTAQL